MITTILEYASGDTFVYEFRGLSTDTKPTKCGNGSVFYEIDTKKVFMFNEATHTWVEQ